MTQKSSKGRRLTPAHIILFIVFIIVRKSFANESESHGGSSEHSSFDSHNHHSGEGSKQGDGHHDGGHHEAHFSVFHVNFEHVEVPFIIALWIFVSSLAKVGFHMTPKLHTIFPESCLLVVVGILIGFLLFLTAGHPPSTLTPGVFFLFMLPPIILDAGYFMPNRLFFDHLGTILLMAIVGTIWNMLTIGGALYACGYYFEGIYGPDPPNILETLLFSSLICAVDPVAVLAVFEEIQVDEILYIVVFGESLLNDAVTVVLYDMFEVYSEIGEENLTISDIIKGFLSFFVVAFGGTLIGVIWGYITGFVTRFTSHARILEPLFVFTMAYLSYLTAEIFKMSGILAITFCGITMKNYVERNISSKSQTTLKYAMKMLSGSSETIIFMFLGVATIHDDHEWNWAFISLTILFCTVFRCLGVLIFSFIANRHRLHKLKFVDQFVMMYGGLRGAVAFALVLLIDKKKVPHAPMFVTTTIAVVYWTVFVQGITIKPLVKFLNVKTSDDKEPTMNERIATRSMDHIIAGMEGILGELGNLRMRDMYKRIDQKYIKPCLLRENHFRDPKIIETYENLTNKDAIEFMKKNPGNFTGLNKAMQEVAEAPANTSMLIAFQNSGNMFPEENADVNVENLDMKEMIYTQTQKDVAETKIHHLLSENLFMPKNRPRRMSYSRHAVNEADLGMGTDVNYKMHMQVRRMVSEGRNLRRRKRTQELASYDELNEYEKPDKNYNLPKGIRVTGETKQLKDDVVHQAIKDAESNQPEEYDNRDNSNVINPSTKQLRASSPAEGLRLKVPSLRSRSSSPVNLEKTPIPWLNKYGEMNPAYESDNEDDSMDNNQLRKNTAPAIQSTILPWKNSSYNTDDPNTGNNKTFATAMSKPVKQQEFPPNWIASSAPTGEETKSSSDECIDDDEDAHAALPPPAIHFLRRGSTAEPGSTMLMPTTNDRAKGRRHSELELEHEASAPQLPYSHIHKSHKGGTHHTHHSPHRAMHGVHRVRGSKKSTESGAPSSIVSIKEDENDEQDVEESGNASKNRYPKIAINLDDEFEKL